MRKMPPMKKPAPKPAPRVVADMGRAIERMKASGLGILLSDTSLPGDIEQKLDPWMKPVIDTVDFLLDISGPIKGHADCASHEVRQ